MENINNKDRGTPDCTSTVLKDTRRLLSGGGLREGGLSGGGGGGGKERVMAEDRTMYSDACQCVFNKPTQAVPNLSPTRREALLFIAERLGQGISCSHIVKRPVKLTGSDQRSQNLGPIAGPKPPIPYQEYLPHTDTHHRKDPQGRLRRFMTVSDITHDASKGHAIAKQLKEERGKMGSRRPVRTAQSAPDLDGRARPPRTSVPVHSSTQPYNSRAGFYSRNTDVICDKNCETRYINDTAEYSVSRPVSTKTHPSVRFNVGVSRASYNSTRFSSPMRGDRAASVGAMAEPTFEACSSEGGKLSPLESGSSENIDIDFELETFIPADQVPESLLRLESPMVIRKKATSLTPRIKSLESFRPKSSKGTTILLKPRSLNFGGERVPTNSGKLPKAFPSNNSGYRADSPTLEKLKSARLKLGALGSSRTINSEKDEDILCDDITSLPFPPSPTPRHKPKISLRVKGMTKPSTQLLKLVRNGTYEHQSLLPPPPQPPLPRALGHTRRIDNDKEGKAFLKNILSTKLKQNTEENAFNMRYNTEMKNKESELQPLKTVGPGQPSRNHQSQTKPRFLMLKPKDSSFTQKTSLENDKSLIVQSFPLPKVTRVNNSGRKSRTLDVNIPRETIADSSEESTVVNSDIGEEKSVNNFSQRGASASCVRSRNNIEEEEHQNVYKEGSHQDAAVIRLQRENTSLLVAEGSFVNERKQCRENCPFVHESKSKDRGGEAMPERAPSEAWTEDGTRTTGTRTDRAWPGSVMKFTPDPNGDADTPVNNQLLTAEDSPDITEGLNHEKAFSGSNSLFDRNPEDSEALKREDKMDKMSRQGTSKSRSAGSRLGSQVEDKTTVKFLEVPEQEADIMQSSSTDPSGTDVMGTGGILARGHLGDDNVKIPKVIVTDNDGYSQSCNTKEHTGEEEEGNMQMASCFKTDPDICLQIKSSRQTSEDHKQGLKDNNGTSDGHEKGKDSSLKQRLKAKFDIKPPVIETEVIIRRERSKINLNELDFDRSKNKGLMRIAANSGLDAEEANDLYYTRDPKILSKVFIDRLVDIAFGSDDEDSENENE